MSTQKKSNQTKNKLNIFEALNKISTKDAHYYARLSVEHQKAFQPYVIQRWLSGTKDSGQIVFLNEVVNPYVFSLYEHKHLLYQLSTVCTDGTPKKYNWIKPHKASKNPLTIEVVCQYFCYGVKEAKDLIPILSKQQIIDYGEQLGYDKEKITKLKKELS